MSSGRPFRIIIAGGGVAGLTLAIMLERFEVDYILLEAHKDIAPPVGASIGLMPNGLLILDQLGCYEAIRRVAQGTVENSHIRSADGKSLTCTRHMQELLEQRYEYSDIGRSHADPSNSHGYPMLFFDRQWLLQELFNRIQHKDRVLTEARLTQIVHLDTIVEVTTADGRCFTGDMIVGSDGIHSTVRREMRRLAEESRPQHFPIGEEDQVPCYYQCSFGIAQHVDGWPPGDQGFTIGLGQSFLVASGPDSRCYWFMFNKLPHAKYGKDIPRYTREDEVQFVKDFGHLHVTENLTFNDIYTKRISSALTPLHEVVYEKWFFERTVVIGDAAHKPNPIGGQGGNSAIESAAELVNILLSVRDERRNGLNGLTSEEVEAISREMQRRRHNRVTHLVNVSRRMQAAFAFENPLLSKFIWAVTPFAGDKPLLQDMGERFLGTSRLIALPVPARRRLLPFDFELPASPMSARVRRLGNGAVVTTMGLALLWSIRVPRVIEGSQEEVLRGLTDMLSASAVYIIEGYRADNQGTLSSLPSLFTMGIKAIGFDHIAPLYAITSAIQSSQSPAGRTVDPDMLSVAGPALAFGCVLPAIASTQGAGELTASSQWLRCLLVQYAQNLPLAFSIGTSMLTIASKWWRKRQTTRNEQSVTKTGESIKLPNVNTDLRLLKPLYRSLFITQATVHILTLGYSWYQNLAMTPVMSVRPSVVGLFGQSVYSIWNLRQAGYITTMEALVAAGAALLGQIVVGPGATLSGLWTWREAVLIRLSRSSQE